jgi:ketosteroid isomerase-like protein
VAGVSRQIEILRRGFADFNAGRSDAWMAFWDERSILHELPEIPDKDNYVGLTGLREWLKNLRGVLGEFSFEPRSFEQEGDYVLAGVDARGAGAGAGVPVAWQPWIVFRFRGETVAEAWGFLDEGQAREQAGIPPATEDAVG